MNSKQHWENIYQTKKPEEVSWTQPVPVTSLNFIRKLNLPKASRIIDIGGGDSKLVDHLFDEGNTDLTVLDISEHAIERAQARLGPRHDKVQWIVGDLTLVKLPKVYDLWHDRAAFHFLISSEDVANTPAGVHICRPVVHM